MTRNNQGITMDNSGHYVLQYVSQDQDWQVASEWGEFKNHINDLADEKKQMVYLSDQEQANYPVRCKICNKSDLVIRKRLLKTDFHFESQHVLVTCPRCSAMKRKYVIAFNPLQATCYQAIQSEC